MPLRSNRVLNLFALILFTFEFLSPAMVTGLAFAQAPREKISAISSSQLHAPFSLILFEELCVNEEGKEFGRDTNPQVIDLFLTSPYQHLLQSDLIATLASANIFAQFDAHPPLFLVHRKLLI